MAFDCSFAIPLYPPRPSWLLYSNWHTDWVNSHLTSGVFVSSRSRWAFDGESSEELDTLFSSLPLKPYFRRLWQEDDDVLVVDYNYYEKRCRAYVNDTPLGHQQIPRLIRNGKESSEADEIELSSRFICPE